MYFNIAIAVFLAVPLYSVGAAKGQNKEMKADSSGFVVEIHYGRRVKEGWDLVLTPMGFIDFFGHEFNESALREFLKDSVGQSDKKECVVYISLTGDISAKELFAQLDLLMRLRNPKLATHIYVFAPRHDPKK